LLKAADVLGLILGHRPNSRGDEFGALTGFADIGAVGKRPAHAAFNKGFKLGTGSIKAPSH